MENAAISMSADILLNENISLDYQQNEVDITSTLSNDPDKETSPIETRHWILD